jgi:UDP-N-acetylmuramate dehydrogenase
VTETLAGFTTLRLGGPAQRLVHASCEEELVAAVEEADAAQEPVLLLGGGSNLVVADHGFPGAVVRIETRGIEVERPGGDGNGGDGSGGGGGDVVLTVAAGESWEALVDLAVREGWLGIEALAGIPGSVGATPIQNVGAYGQEVAQTITSVRCWDRVEHAERVFAAPDCGFGYRTSRFKREPGRYVVLAVTFSLRTGTEGTPVRYAELARRLDVLPGRPAPAARVRQEVLDLRRGKGMVLDQDDHDTWSAGSFFTNPFLSAEAAAGLPDGAPRWAQGDGTVKTSAAWLIEGAGFTKGYRRGRVGLSTKHTLALTNRGGATTQDLLALATEIQQGVHARFGVELVNEPVLVGCSLPPVESAVEPAVEPAGEPAVS